MVIDNKVKIVDEQTGRVMEGRRYSDGLHQAIEAKERVKVRQQHRHLPQLHCRTFSVCTANWLV